MSRPTFLAGILSIAAGSITYGYLSINHPTDAPLHDVTRRPVPFVSPQPGSQQTDQPADLQKNPRTSLPPSTKKSLNRKSVPRDMIDKSSKASVESDLESRIYAALANFGLRGVGVLFREGQVRLTGQLREESDRPKVLDAVRLITQTQIGDGLIYTSDRWLAYRTLRQTNVYSEPSQDASRITYISGDLRVWVTEIRENWVRIESKKGARPGYVRREQVMPDSSLQ